jgi:hypothetical protein
MAGGKSTGAFFMTFLVALLDAKRRCLCAIHNLCPLFDQFIDCDLAEPHLDETGAAPVGCISVTRFAMSVAALVG